MNCPPARRTPLSLAIALLSLTAASNAAFAQATAASDAPPGAPAAAASAADTPKAAPVTNLDSVVVTATRRSERLEDVPLAVTAVKAGDLEAAGIKDLNSIIQAVPGLDFTEGNRNPGFRVRGVGSFVSTQYFTNAELPVGVVVDGVVQGLGPSLSNLGEVERIEVLKGPQGTQFGKNSAAGVINITTIRPELGELGGDVYASYGNRSQYEARGAINVPLGTVAAMRASVFKSGYGGFIENVPSGREIGGNQQGGGAVKFIVKPTTDLDFFVSADTSDDRTVGGSNALLTVNSIGPYPSAPPGITAGLTNLKNGEAPWLIGEQVLHRAGASVEANYRLGGYTLTSLTAYRQRSSRDDGGATGGMEAIGPGALPPAFGTVYFFSDSQRRSRQETQEFRVTSPKSDFIEYVAGYLFYRQPTLNKEFGGYIVRQPVMGTYYIVNPQHGMSQVDTTVTSNAVFGDGKIKLLPTTDILLGLRYTKDRISAEFTNPFYGDSPIGAEYNAGGAINAPVIGPPGGITSPPSATTVRASKLTYKIGVEHRLSPDLLAFATYSTGYLGPVINYKFNGTADTLKPQTNGNITVGVKSQFLARQLTVNADVFQDKYKNVQTGFFDGATLQFVGENAASATSRGLELEVNYRTPNGFSAGGNLAYVHSAYGDYCSGDDIGLSTIPACTTPSGATGGQLKGYSLQGVPKFTSTLFVSQKLRVADAYSASFGANYYFRTKTRTRSADPLTQTPAFGLFGVNGRFGPESEAWHVGLYARNLFNKIAPQVDADGHGPYYHNLPTRDNLRSFGVSVDASF